MATEDLCVTIHPYFRIHAGQRDNFKHLCNRFVQLTSEEEKCLYYGFSFNGDIAYCREGYADADGLLRHLENVGEPLNKALTMADLIRLEIHGPESELVKLRKPLAVLNPDFFVLEYGFRN